jgi:putative flippase GtrA
VKKIAARVRARLDALPPLHRQIALFIVTGGVNTVFAYLAYAFFAGLLDLPPLRSLVFSYMAGIPFSYMTFRAFVFTGGDRSFRTFAKFLPTYGVLLVINLAALYELAHALGWNKLLAQAVVVPFCAALSFVINRAFVFRERKA